MAWTWCWVQWPAVVAREDSEGTHFDRRGRMTVVCLNSLQLSRLLPLSIASLLLFGFETRFSLVSL